MIYVQLTGYTHFSTEHIYVLGASLKNEKRPMFICFIMENHDQNLTPHLEWEFSDFPITIKQLKFEKNNWGFEESPTIVIWRNENYQLIGKINGSVRDFRKHEDNDFIGQGNIVKGQLITGFDSGGNIVELKECLFAGIHTNSVQFPFAEGELSIDAIHIRFASAEIPKIKTRLDWFVCEKVSARLFRTTHRNRKLENKKIRVGIDDFVDSIENHVGSSSSKDYTIVNLPDYKFIVAKVPDSLLNGDVKGICFEYRENLELVTEDIIYGTKCFLSFLLGNELQNLGYSIISGNDLLEVYLCSISKLSHKGAMPPIKFNTKYNWGDISFLLNSFLPVYLNLRNSLKLDNALEKYWISKRIPLGANLPVLASALETIAGEYLKTKKHTSEYISESDYLNLIEKEKEQLEIKLSSIEGGQIMLNKILGAFRKGPNEKMNIFFSEINIEIGKSEKSAINLRNKMAHGNRDYSKDKNVHNDLIHSTIYKLLFHRIILKLIGYDGYYIDYSLQGCPSKHIDTKAGE